MFIRIPIMNQYSTVNDKAGLVVLLALLLTACQTKRAPTWNPEQQAIKQHEIPSAKEPELSRDQLTALLRQKIKYVFVLYQENRSFDSYFGTFPGADGLFSQPPKDTPGFNQSLMDTDGTMGIIQPFRIGP
ncbi:MAG TPA: alkaline phosphatase family protein, partial [Terriglobia bacterium]|nr:alkaline phosphatase family protein [Terriglobia bacterium]